jgi:hypothetical protein
VAVGELGQDLGLMTGPGTGEHGHDPERPHAGDQGPGPLDRI